MYSFQGSTLATILICIEPQCRRDPHWNCSSSRS
jgi:hypothetical protein